MTDLLLLMHMYDLPTQESMYGLPCRSTGTVTVTVLYGGGIPWLITVIPMEFIMGVIMPARWYTSVYGYKNRYII